MVQELLCDTFDNCGVCFGNNDCSIFIQDEIQITDESLVSDDQAIQIFYENFESLMETQLGLPEGTVVVLSVTFDNNRGEVNVIVNYTITLTEEDIEVSNFDSNLSFDEIKDQINLNIVSVVWTSIFKFIIY